MINKRNIVYNFLSFILIILFIICINILNKPSSSFIMDNIDLIGIAEEQKIEIEGTISTNIDMLEKYYLALNGTKKLNIKIDYPNGYSGDIRYKIYDNNIINIIDDTIIGVGVGETSFDVILSDGNTKNYKVLVTDLIVPMNLDNKKELLSCMRYTEEEALLLDEILDSRIKEAGIGTRGAVVAIERFITLEFPYSIRYFNENGRLVDHGYRKHIDAEGRYYHKGLYLSESKFADLEPGASTKTGPAIWGCKIYDAYVDRMNANGFTCSGYVTWVLYNAGLDIGDVGAGDYKEFDDDLSDMGEHHEITKEYMKSGNYKVGDFIARNGHAALIIGIDENNIYTSEALPPKLKIYSYQRYDGIVKDKNLTYVIEMDGIYPNGEGNYENMW